MYPRRSPTTHTEQLGEEVSVYDAARAQVHALNPTAARVWRQCDGTTSPEAIAAVLRVEMGIPEAEAVVDLTLTQLARVHLLELPVESRGDRSAPTRRWLLSRGLAAAMLPAIYSIVAPSPVAAQSVPATGSTPFAFTGDVQTFTVPPGVTTLTVTALGAQGGAGAAGTSPGGLGGSVTATLTVAPGETLNVFVGGQGGTGTSIPPSGAGGFNGGGAGGSGFFGGGGGGASDIRQGGSALSNRVVVAGGGGGGALNLNGGGAGGGTTGATGFASLFPFVVNGGGGGTPLSGGLGGVNPTSSPNNGLPGVSGTGGAGGPGTAAGAAGGGGGGGYFGGGGGAGGFANLGSAGGGGGSSLDASGVVHAQGIHAGDGEVTVSW